MSIIDWIPGVSTAKNLLTDPAGRQASDYTCNMDRTACGTAGQAAAIIECNRDIDGQARAYITTWVPSWGDVIVGAAVSATLTVIVAQITRVLIARAAATAAIATSGGITVLLALDGVFNLYLVISKLNEIKVAALQAQSTCCACRPAACGGGAPVATSETIKRWYWGPIRSFTNTKADMQTKAQEDYKLACPGACTGGKTCTPVAYVTEWEQGGFGMSYTWLKYDVYCECV